MRFRATRFHYRPSEAALALRQSYPIDFNDAVLLETARRHGARVLATDDIEAFLEDFFWRVSLSPRYSQSVETRVFQDVHRMDKILIGQRPDYDWPVSVSE